MPHDFFYNKNARKVTKSAKNANKCLNSAQKFRQISKRRDFIVSVLLFAHSKRVGVFCMQGIFVGQMNIQIYFMSQNFMNICQVNIFIYTYSIARIQETSTLSTDADSRTTTNFKRLCDLSKEEEKMLRGCVIGEEGFFFFFLGGGAKSGGFKNL